MRRVSVLMALVASTALLLMMGGSNISGVPLPVHGVILPEMATIPVLLANDGGSNTPSPFMTTVVNLPGQPLVLGGGLYTTIRTGSLSPLATATALQFLGTTSPLATVNTGNDSVSTVSGGPGHVLIVSTAAVNLANSRMVGLS